MAWREPGLVGAAVPLGDVAGQDDLVGRVDRREVGHRLGDGGEACAGGEVQIGVGVAADGLHAGRVERLALQHGVDVGADAEVGGEGRRGIDLVAEAAMASAGRRGGDRPRRSIPSTAAKATIAPKSVMSTTQGDQLLEPARLLVDVVELRSLELHVSHAQLPVKARTLTTIQTAARRR